MHTWTVSMVIRCLEKSMYRPKSSLIRASQRFWSAMRSFRWLHRGVASTVSKGQHVAKQQGILLAATCFVLTSVRYLLHAPEEPSTQE